MYETKKTQEEKIYINTKNHPTTKIFITHRILAITNITNTNRNIIAQIQSKTMMKKQYFLKFSKTTANLQKKLI